MSDNEETLPSTGATEKTDGSDTDSSLIGGAEAAEGDKGTDAAKEAAVAKADVEAKAAAEAKQEGDDGKDKGEGKPEALVVENLKFPEGFQRNDENLKAMTDVLGDTALSPQDRAQALIDLHTTAMQDMSAKVDQQWQDERSKWVEATKALPKIGGDNLDASLGKIARLIEEFGKTTDAQGVVSKDLGNEFRQVLDDSGLGDHPTIVRFLVNVADSFSEGTPISGEAASGERTQAQKMYPDMN